MEDATTARVVARPTPSAPPCATNPWWHEMRAISVPKTEALISPV